MSAFYIINAGATPTEAQAQTLAAQIAQQGYATGYLWIPDYASLSGARMYAVYIGPFATQRECEEAVEAYRRIKPDAYGLKVSQERQRVEIRGVGRVSVKGV